MIINSVYTVLVIFILIGVGYFISHKKWVDRTTVQAFPKIIINFSVPAQVLTYFANNFTSEQLSKSGMLILAPFLAVIASFFCGMLAARVLNVRKTRRGVFSVLFSLSNSVFIGFPVAKALFGDIGMPYATFFYISNTICFWTLGYYGVKKDAEYITGEIQKISISEILKKIVSVPLIFIAASFVLIMFNVKIPDIILKPAEYLGNLTTPLSMMFIGCILYDIGFKKLKMDKDLIYVLLGRFVISGVIMFGACELFHVTGLPQHVYVMQMTLPAMTSTIIITELNKADSDFATKGMAWTTLLSLVTIPLVSLIIGQ